MKEDSVKPLNNLNQHMLNRIRNLALFISILVTSVSFSQTSTNNNDIIDYASPREYELGGITVSGVQYLDESVLITLTGLTVGEKYKIPGEKISQSIENLWKQGILADIKITATKVIENRIFLDFQVQEKPRLSKFSFVGINKGEADKLREKLQLVKGKVITENLILTSKNKIKEYYSDKGFLFTEIKVESEKDSSAGPNNELLVFTISNKTRIKINDITFHGLTEFTPEQLKAKMKGTKERAFYKIFSTSKFNDSAFDEDKEKLIAKYNSKGFRDAKVEKDSIYKFDDKSVNVEVWINEGHRYYFRNLSWVGNTKYSTTLLSQMLGINKGDIYNQAKLEEGLFMSQSGKDISSLYMDDGYLFFSVTPVEVRVENDSIDLELRIYEGKQAVINNVTVRGNSKTSDKVILRELRTKPGQLFSRTDIIRTQRELSQLGYFDQEKLSVNPKPNPADGTVDIEYIVEERPSDQLELSGGWGGGTGIVGTLGVSFNNFSARNIFNKDSYSPLPSGDGQKLSLRFQSNGRQFQSYNASFTEPWLGGKKPNSFSFSIYRSIQRTGVNDVNGGKLDIIGSSLGLGRRLKVPDDFFSAYNEVKLQHYTLKNWNQGFIYNNGESNILSFLQTFSRNSVDGLIWIRTGSQISFSVELTPPYSLINKKDYKTMTDQEKYKWVEYHKWKFNGSWYKSIGDKLVLFNRAQFGVLGFYNSDVGQSPFNRFYLGGDGLAGFSLDGREIIALRGYANNSVTPKQAIPNSNGVGTSLVTVGGTTYNKFSMELRYPISLNPSATIYVLGFLEAGNNYLGTRYYSPIDLKRSAGAGVRVFLPMFGLLGLDWGYGFDEVEGSPGAGGANFHFTLGQQF